MTLPSGTLGAFPWQRFRWAKAHIHFARAIGAARTGDTASARQDVEKLADIPPNRFNGLYGAARAARLASDQKRAKTYYAKLMELCRQADSLRPEIEDAKAFLAGSIDSRSRV